METEVVPSLVQTMEAVRFRAECGGGVYDTSSLTEGKKEKWRRAKNNVKSKETNEEGQ
jgi:hypothetical protein